ncbi:MAG: ABCB family ABC transporter ATP-binding protein/permease [Rhodobacterales bacterium]|jgi:ABC-type transport system involved in Fe-S cluster assembly fused permease/ATPase subunit|tara:strand:- start:1296 stop:3131 length:1836 start_codon:yes stop_codon:yes gene_type:complete
MSNSVKNKTTGSTSSNWRTVKRVTPYLWPKASEQFWVKRRVVLAMLALTLSKIIAVATPFLFKAAVDGLAKVGESNDALMLLLGAGGLMFAYGFFRLSSVGFGELRDAIFARVGQRALRSLALETFEHIHALSLRYHISRKTGGLSRIIERGVKGVDFLLRFMLFSIIPLLIELTLVATILFIVFDVWYLAVILVTISLYIWFTFTVSEWRLKVRQEMNRQDTDANQKAIDSLLNFETVKYFNAEKVEAARYDSSMRLYEAAALKTSYSLSFLNFGQAFLITSGLVTVMVMAAFGVQSGDLTVGDFVLVNAYMIQITMPLNFLGTVYREIRQALVDMSEMFDLLEQPPEVTDDENAYDLVVREGLIDFKDITFGYEKNRVILKNFNLSVGAGQNIAIVGTSGSGKSTIGRLLFRFYDTDKGALFIDGVDIKEVTQSSLHSAIGIVPQDTVLFNDTIYYNIAYGNTEASYDKVIEAARAAKIHEFISNLPDGYDTTVGERGLKLSGGEKQRVGIARTLLKNPPILLLDEATSSLDTETENSIQDSLNKMLEDRTVITIAHRLSTIVKSDLIVVLENGEIVEQGTHIELLDLKRRYSKMWKRQANEQEVKVHN